VLFSRNPNRDVRVEQCSDVGRETCNKRHHRQSISALRAPQPQLAACNCNIHVAHLPAVATRQVANQIAILRARFRHVLDFRGFELPPLATSWAFLLSCKTSIHSLRGQPENA
jgi:hypothetical protein